MKFKNIFNSQAKNSFKKKVISTALIAGVITSSTNSFAGTLSEDLRYETFNDNNVSITNILEDSNENLKIEGETLVNLAHEPSGWVYNNETIAFIRVNASTLKPNTDYTVLFYGNMGDIHNSATTLQNVTENNNLSIGESSLNKYKYKVRTNNMIHDGGEAPIYIIPHIYPKEGIVFTQDYLDNLDLKVMILEGDWTDRETPEYFEGMKSSFEDNLVTQEMVDSGLEDKKNLGKYKAEIEVTEKNLFDINKPFNIPYGTLVSGRDVVNVDGVLKTNALTGIISSYSQKYNLLKNTYYTLSATAVNGDISFRIYDDSKYQNITEKVFKDGIRNSITFNTGDLSPEYLRIVFHRMQDVDSGIKDVQIEMSSTASEYQPYKKSVKTFYLDSPLHKGDSIENINGTVYHIKRSEQTYITGDNSEKWELGSSAGGWNQDGDTLAFYSYDLLKNKGKGSGNSLTDKFNTVNNKSIVSNNQNELFASSLAGNGSHYSSIRINKSKLETEDANGLQKWLNLNPVKVVYELATPEYKVLDTDLNIQLTKGNTHISHNSKIPTNLNITVDRTANRAYEAIELAKTSPTVENLARARMWINLLNDSTVKDDFQDTVSDITNLTDMQLEKKKVSANIDLYVKSENSLSMSLSTNSITFDNYTGTENMEKLQAVEISINSSLPYDLNAYLETNFSNSDGSKSMDINTLKIKESSKSNYSSFTNLKEKVTLVEDCSSGNYIKHDIDLKLESDNAYQPDIYKTTVKFEAIQK